MCTELKVIRAATAGTALGAFGPWAEVIDRAWQLGAQRPAHLVSDGDGAIASRIELVYGGEAAHQLSLLRLLREYRRNIGVAGFVAARRLLDATSLAEGRAMGAADYALDGWGSALLVRESVVQRAASFDDGAGGASADFAFERHNRELRRREQLGTVWTEHNLLALLPEQGLLN